MILSYAYKLNPSHQQSERMGRWLEMLCSQYNFSLRERVEAYEQVKAPVLGNFCRLDNQGECCSLTCSVSKSALYGYPWKQGKPSQRRGKLDKPSSPRRSAFEIQCSEVATLRKARPWYQDVPVDVIQQNLRRVEDAFKRFFSGQNDYPQFKRRSRFRSFEFKPGTVRLEGKRVKLPAIGWMPFFNSRPRADGFSIKTVTVRRKADGWYMSVRLEDKLVPVLPAKYPDEVVKPLGVDLGVRKLAALSNGEFVCNPRFGAKLERRKAIRSRRASRKLKGSNNRRKAYQALARLDLKIERQRTDYQWKVANQLNRASDCIIFEDLNIQGMSKRCKPKEDESGKFVRNGQAAKSGLNKAILDAAWGGLIEKTKAVAVKSSNIVWQINPRKTSQACKICHFVSPSNRNGEKFLCENCGEFDDADANASHNILMRGCVELGISPDAVCGVPAKLGKNTPLEISLALAGEPGNPGNREDGLSNQAVGICVHTA